MTNVASTKQLNLTVPYTHWLSPVSNNATLHGLITPTHISNVSIVYTNATLPTPWPVLLAGLLWSFISALRLLIRSRSSTWARIVSFVFSLIGSVRCISAFISTTMAVAGDGGRFRPPSGAVVLLLSVVPYVVDEESFAISCAVAAVGSFFSFITVALMVAVRVNYSNDYYAKWLVNAGNCPIVVGIDTLSSCPFSAYVGCGLDQIQQTAAAAAANNALYGSYVQSNNPNTFENRNHLALGETVLGLLLISPALIGIGIVLLFLVLGLYTLWKGIILIGRCLASPFDRTGEILDLDDGNKPLGLVLGPLFALVIAIYIGTSFPLHYIQQTRPTSFLVLDSYGPLDFADYDVDALLGEPILGTWTGDSVNGTSWSDYFYVETPVDSLGFLQYWWNANFPLLNWLAVM